jgi:hypothetical protein
LEILHALNIWKLGQLVVAKEEVDDKVVGGRELGESIVGEIDGCKGFDEAVFLWDGRQLVVGQQELGELVEIGNLGRNLGEEIGR